MVITWWVSNGFVPLEGFFLARLAGFAAVAASLVRLGAPIDFARVDGAGGIGAGSVRGVPASRVTVLG